MSYFIFSLILILTIVLGVWFYYETIPFLKVKTKNNLKLRGLAKIFALENFEEDTEKVLKRWLVSLFVFSIIPCFWVFYFSWATDYSFLIGLFPLLWYYFTGRYILWEKHDLYDEDIKKKEIKNNEAV
ncbi:MAG: hypothetical protein OEZ22_12695 [Spirochaetia bacterium]|nr:hypothetical protein [Spirochaetia bacterium]